jgi:integrase
MDSKSVRDASAQLVLFAVAKPSLRQRRPGPVSSIPVPKWDSREFAADPQAIPEPSGATVRPSGKQHTPAHINCSACEGKGRMFTGSLSPSMSVSEAIRFYIAWRTGPALRCESKGSPPKSARGKGQFVGKRTLKDYTQKGKALVKFFGDMPLDTVKVVNMNAYQDARLNAEGFTRFYGEREVASHAGPIKINAELAFLKQLMTLSKCWTPEHEQYYETFQEPEPDQLKALDPDQQDYFLKTAASDPRWHPIWWYALVALHLTFSSDEMRPIRLGDLNLHHQIVGVNPSFGKNAYRRRSVTIEDGACLWALERLIERATILWQTSPNYRGPQPHYCIFPFRVVKNLYDPELPMGETGLRMLFEEVREKAGVPEFQFNAFRHTGLTRLAEAGVPPYVMEKRAGHIGAKMMRRYVQISEQAQRIAMRNALGKKPPMPAMRNDVAANSQLYRSN